MIEPPVRGVVESLGVLKPTADVSPLEASA
jgi:hypothetical protein